MKKVIIFFFLTMFVSCFWQTCVPSVQAQETVLLTDEKERYPLGLHLEYLEDPANALTIDEVASAAYETKFIPGESEVTTIGFTGSAYWVRVHLRNNGYAQTDWRLAIPQPYISFIDLYLPDTTGQFQLKQAGAQRPFDVREVKHRYTVFKVALPPTAEQTLYLRLQSGGGMVFDLTLWSAEAFHTDASHQQLFLGAFLGALGIMVAYNLFLFVALNDRAYLYYVLLLVCLIVHLATLEYGLTYQYLWPNWPKFNHLMTGILPVFTLFFSLNFTMVFLQTRRYAPMLHRLMLGLTPLYILLAILNVLQQKNLMFVGEATVAVPTIIVMITAGVQAWRNGYRPARYYVLAWSMLWLNALAFALHLLGLVNVPNHLQFVPFTVTGMVLFLSLALADRINVLKKNTEQAKAETDDTNKKLEEQQQQLAQNEKKYRTIFEDSKDIIFLTSLDGQIEDINPACEALLGYSRNEILHQSVLQLYSNPADRDHLSKLMLKNGSVKDLAIKLRRKDGRDIDSMATATLRHDENGVVTGFQGVIRDVTALKEAEAERLRALEFQSEKELAETANQAKSVFLANMSHELRTPLNAILGFSELMTRDQNLTLDQQRDLGTIGRSGEHLLALINDVLEFSKIEAGNVELRLENFDIQRMLVSLEDMFRIRAESKELALEIICEADVPRLIRADQNKMRQVLINLLGNAVEYTQKGGISLRVQIGKNQTEDLAPSADSHLRVPLRFEVEDSGKGIAEDDLESIFKAFFQSDNESQSSHGTGLGLPISQEFVRMMGGELAVSSKVGSGSKFYFELMVEQVEDSESVVEKPSQRVTGLSPGQQDFRILVAEDNAISRELMVKLLRQVGFDTREVTNGKEAVVEFEQWRPHLIWMDIRMPVMDGYEATRRIKNMPAGAETIIIALTASAFEEDRLEALEQGCDGFVRKPFRENEIFELMRKFLNVNFRYEKTPHKTSMANKAKRVKLTPELLVELSDELRLELKKAVDAVAFEETMAVIDKIPAQDETVADALTDLANQYRFDRLQELLSDSTQAVANAGGRAC